MTTLRTPELARPGSASAPPDRAAPASNPARALRHALVLAKRNLIKTMRTPEQLIDVTLQPIIFLLLFVYVFGGAIGSGLTGSGGPPGSGGVAAGGGTRHEYLQFLLPGMLAQGIAMGSVALGQNLNADIEKGVFDRFRSLPIARSAPLLGAVMADFFRYLSVCVIFVGFGYVMGFRIGTTPLALLAAVGLSIAFALCFCWISVFIGMKARTPGAVQGVMFMLIFPLSFGSNAFVPAGSMPGWLQAFVKVNPISQLVGAVRGLMISGPVAGHVGWTLLWMAILLVVFVPLAMRGYRRRS